MAAVYRLPLKIIRESFSSLKFSIKAQKNKMAAVYRLPLKIIRESFSSLKFSMKA
jgi:hypothetical protein